MKKRDNITLVCGSAEARAHVSSPDSTAGEFLDSFGIPRERKEDCVISVSPRLYDVHEENVITLMFGDVSVRLKVPSMDANVIADEFLKKFLIEQVQRHGKTGYVIMQRLFSDDEFISDKERALAIKAAEAALKSLATEYAALQKKFYAIHKEKTLPPAQVGARLLESILSAKPTYSGGDLSEPLNVIDKCMLIAIACSVSTSIQEKERRDGAEAVKGYLVNTINRNGDLVQERQFPLSISMEFVISRAIDLFKRSTHTQQAANILQCSDVVWRSISRLTRPFVVAFKDENGRKRKTTLRFISPDVNAEESKHQYMVSPIFFYLYKKLPQLGDSKKNHIFYHIINFGKFCEGFREFGEEYVNLSLTIWAHPSLGRTPLKLPMKYDADASRKAKFDQRKRTREIISKIDPALQIETDKKNVIISKKKDDEKDDLDNADTEKKGGE